MPDPAKGSSTTSPGQVDSRIARRASSTGNGAGWRPWPGCWSRGMRRRGGDATRSSTGRPVPDRVPPVLQPRGRAAFPPPWQATRIDSQSPRRFGAAGDCHDPHAVPAPARTNTTPPDRPGPGPAALERHRPSRAPAAPGRFDRCGRAPPASGTDTAVFTHARPPRTSARPITSAASAGQTPVVVPRQRVRRVAVVGQADVVGRGRDHRRHRLGQLRRRGVADIGAPDGDVAIVVERGRSRRRLRDLGVGLELDPAEHPDRPRRSGSRRCWGPRRRAAGHRAGPPPAPGRPPSRQYTSSRTPAAPW